MIGTIISEVQNELRESLDANQLRLLGFALSLVLSQYDIKKGEVGTDCTSNIEVIDKFIAAKRLEGCSEKTIDYYTATVTHALDSIKKPVVLIDTDDLRGYLMDYKDDRACCKVTIDNIRRILSSFFTWLEDEDIIIKSPIRRIKKIKMGRTVKDTFSDEDLEKLRDSVDTSRDLSIIDMLASTGIRVGELVNLNIEDVDFENRECKVYGKGDNERIVYFDARAKLHLREYLLDRVDDDHALFVGLNSPHTRLSIGCVESRLKSIGRKAGIDGTHPHKFRRTMATHAIDKGMPIEQVQKLLGHVRIDTTMHYAIVNQGNVKISHRRYIG